MEERLSRTPRTLTNLTSLIGTPRRLLREILKPFRDQQPASVLIRQTARKEWRLISLNLLCSIIQAASEGLTLGVMFLAVQVLSKPPGKVFEIGQNPLFNFIPHLTKSLDGLTSFQAFTILLTLAVILKIIQGAAMYVGSLAIGDFGSRVSCRLKSGLHAQILNFSFSCASRYRVGDLLYINSSGPGAVINEINNYNGILTTTLLLLTYLAVLIRLSPWLLFAAIVMGGISILVQQYVLPRAGKLAKISTELGIELSSRMTENIQGLRLLHTSGYLDEAASEVDRRAQLLQKNAGGQIRLGAINGPVTLVLPILMIAVIAWLSLLFFGQRSSGVLPSLVTFVVALQRLNGSIGGLSSLVLSRKVNEALLNVLNNFLLKEDKQFRRKTNETYRGFNRDIQLQNVELVYSADLAPALSGVNILIPKGHTIALVGSSGAGKSSIADLLAGLYEPSHGRILVDGTDLRTFDPQSWQKRIGVVSQDTFLFNASIADNITFGTPGATQADLEFAAKHAQAAGFISKLPDGFNTLVGERGYKLSGGQRQRLSLARAILRDPDLLILDEATSALDTESERLVQEAIDQFDRQHTILVIAHRLSTIVNADCIFVLDHGQVIEQGNHNELLAKEGRYARLWQQQVKASKIKKVTQPT
jgi:subfamily B ATP-binding cassette protein MsbA